MGRRNFRSMSTTQPSSSRLQEFLGSLPPITLGLLFLNVGVHILFFLTSWSVNDYSFLVIRVIYNGEVYRVFTSAFLHAGLFHIAMNMMSLVALGGLLESNYGSVRFLWITLLSLILTGCIAICFLWLCAVLISPGFLFTNSIGYSGVLFSYALIESFHATDTMRSVMGVFSVPTKIYPFVLLLILQFILPNISFSGHLSGILAGIVLISGIGSDLLIPSNERFERIESCLIPSSIRRLPSYRPITNRSFVHPYFDTRQVSHIAYNACMVLYQIVGTGLTFTGYLLSTLLVIVGCPVESWLGYISSLGSGILNSMRSAVSGYELLPNADTSVHSAHNATVVDIETSAASADSAPLIANHIHSPPNAVERLKAELSPPPHAKADGTTETKVIEV